jgi:diadenylate cyclase
MKIGFLDIEWFDVLDVLLLAFLLYQIYFLVKGTIASRIFLGYLLIYLLYLVAKAIGLELLTTILGYFISVGALALIIISSRKSGDFCSSSANRPTSPTAVLS